MLANPVLVPAYAAPEVWAFAMLSMWAEIRTELSMLRRMRVATPGLWRTLLFINLATWLAFLLALDRLDQSGASLVGSIAVLEALVVVAESLLIRAAHRSLVRVTLQQPVSLSQAFRVSLVGNLVSISCSILLPVAIFWLLS